MKKTLVFILVMLIAFSLLTACGNIGANNTSGTNANSTSPGLLQKIQTNQPSK